MRGLLPLGIQGWEGAGAEDKKAPRSHADWRLLGVRRGSRAGELLEILDKGRKTGIQFQASPWLGDVLFLPRGKDLSPKERVQEWLRVFVVGAGKKVVIFGWMMGANCL